VTGTPARTAPPPPPGPQTVHVGAWSWLLSDYVCVMCHAMFSVLAWAGCNHAGDCPGFVQPAPPGAALDYPPDPHGHDTDKEFPW
jgi:hypothetical protein